MYLRPENSLINEKKCHEIAVSMSEAFLEAIGMDGLNDLHGIQADLQHLEFLVQSSRIIWHF